MICEPLETVAKVEATQDMDGDGDNKLPHGAVTCGDMEVEAAVEIRRSVSESSEAIDGLHRKDEMSASDPKQISASDPLSKAA